jgi:hypothetical protein
MDQLALVGVEIGTTPEDIQSFLDTLRYDHEKADAIMDGKPRSRFLRSVKDVISDEKAICIEGALAADWFMDRKYSSNILYLTRIYSMGHAVCVHRDPATGLFGAVGVSRNDDLKSRPPQYKTVEELAMSYRTKDFRFDAFILSSKHRQVSSDWGLRELVIDIGRPMRPFIPCAKFINPFV